MNVLSGKSRTCFLQNFSISTYAGESLQLMSNELHQFMTPDNRGFYPTLNQMGFMLTELDPYVSDFIVKAKSPFLDIGCAFGKSTLYALQLGKEVIANDISEEHIKIIQSQVKSSKNASIKYNKACFPYELHFEQNSLGSVLASRVLHFLKGDDILQGCQKVFDWLQKDGLFCILSETPFRKNLKEFLPIFEQRKKQGDLFPGFVEDIQKYWPSDYKNLPQWINFLEEETTNLILQKVGFDIVFSKSYRRVIELDHMLKDLPNFFISIGRKS